MSTDHAPVPRVANRYGAPKRAGSKEPAGEGSAKHRRWLVWVLIGSAVVATGIFSLFSGSPAVSSKDVGFSIQGPGLARVDYEVTKDPEETAQCAVQVLNSSYAVVGWKVVTIPPASADTPGDGRSTSHSTEVRTESEGVSGGINACWIQE
ncbi:DUF4307 domain-containing protein [Arthrobacter sp. JZ12]|uniref:DUF4307 domain-containing protein n=1 Tax=Arthrobacter sp. JZ12 TaxID=2654190 RepID=UPI002B47E08C|nr:DUF4307 domain-containing protein [Arthrobacter sp. JZ12]WRH24368.1 DUF4307 domain-containing protein [Arthrobacter sp. JZ12]